MTLGTLIIILVGIIILAIVLVVLFQLGMLSIFGAKEAAEGEVNKTSDDYGQLIGRTAKVRTDLDPEGMVYVFGELWKARSNQGLVRQGSTVRVVAAQGMMLIVEAVDAE